MASIVQIGTYDDNANADKFPPQVFFMLTPTTPGNLLVAAIADLEHGSPPSYGITAGATNVFTQVPGAKADWFTFGQPNGSDRFHGSSDFYITTAAGETQMTLTGDIPAGVKIFELSGVDTVDVVSVIGAERDGTVTYPTLAPYAGDGTSLTAEPLVGTSSNPEVYIYVAGCSGTIGSVTPSTPFGIWTEEDWPNDNEMAAYYIGNGTPVAPTFTQGVNKGIVISGIALMLGTPVMGVGRQPNTFVIS